VPKNGGDHQRRGFGRAQIPLPAAASPPTTPRPADSGAADAAPRRTLLKVFLDRLPDRALAGASALPLLVMNSPEQSRAVDAYLRPLLTELGATVPAPALAVLESDLARPDDVLEPWARQVTDALRPAAGRDHHRPDGSVSAMAAGPYSTVTGR
jgi:hypothetical protein